MSAYVDDPRVTPDGKGFRFQPVHGPAWRAFPYRGSWWTQQDGATGPYAQAETADAAIRVILGEPLLAPDEAIEWARMDGQAS